MIEVNAMGKVCPIPVIMTKKVLRENTAGENILIRVDNEIATQNLTKMAAQLNIKSSVTKLNDAEYTVLYDFEGREACTIMNNATVLEQGTDEYVVVINSDKMGCGDEELGKKLLENFVYALTEQDRIPKTIVLYNSGVRIATVNDKTISDLKTLQSKGTEVLACGLCLDFYGLKDKLQVGSPTNMYSITEIMRTNKVVKP